MSDPFVNGLPMRWEFDTLLNRVAAPENTDDYVAARAEVCRAFDAMAARIAELEAENKKMADRLIAGSEPIFASNAQLRARIAREFVEEPCHVPHHHGMGLDCQEKRLNRWEAAAKEGA